MIIKVIGKSHQEGVSKKTGAPYNFNTIHYNAPAYKTEGLAAKQVNLDPGIYPYADVVVSADYVIDFDERGYVVSFLPATKGTSSKDVGGKY